MPLHGVCVMAGAETCLQGTVWHRDKGDSDARAHCRACNVTYYHSLQEKAVECP